MVHQSGSTLSIDKPPNSLTPPKAKQCLVSDALQATNTEKCNCLVVEPQFCGSLAKVQI
jgi:hypothetical protein